MKNLFRSKSTIVVIIIVIILVIAYFYYEGGSSSGSGSLLVSQGGDQSIGSDELNLLSQIQSLKIDTSIFKDPGYQALVDYSVAIPTEPVGRPNPFAPFTGEAVSSGTAGTSGTSGPASH
jgi:hypothetical protein